MALTTSQRQALRGLRVISSRQSAELSTMTRPRPTPMSSTEPSTVRTMPSVQPSRWWGWLMLTALLTVYATLFGIVWGLMQAADQLRSVVG